jgi:hypothetical protein
MKKYIIILLCFVSLPSLTKTYYVSNSGSNSYNGESADSAFGTLQHGANEVVAGDSVFVFAGDYVGFDLRGVDGTESNPIVFKALDDSVRITSDNSMTDDGINLEGPDWVVIDGFTVIGATRTGIRAVGAEHIIIKNNTCFNNGTWGILTGFVDYVTIENNECAYSGSQHGIYHGNSADHPIIRYNTCHHNSGCGIHINADENMGGDGLITDATVEGNIIYGNGESGGSGINCDGVANSKIFNNLIYDEHASGMSLYKIDGADGSYNTKIYNNTIITQSDGRWALNIGTDSKADTVYNNILITFHNWRGSIAICDESLTNFYSDFNILLDRIGLDCGDTRITLEEWQEMGYDSNSILAESMESIFTDWENGNYHLLSTSPAVDSGTSDVSYIVTFDLDGISRPYGNEYDIGAYEYNPSGASIPDEKIQNPCKILIRGNKVLFKNLNPDQTIEIFDVKGALIHKSDQIYETTYKYNIENLQSGIYFWYIKNHRGNGVKGKIIIAR